MQNLPTATDLRLVFPSIWALYYFLPNILFLFGNCILPQIIILNRKIKNKWFRKPIKKYILLFSTMYFIWKKNWLYKSSFALDSWKIRKIQTILWKYKSILATDDGEKTTQIQVDRSWRDSTHFSSSRRRLTFIDATLVQK